MNSTHCQTTQNILNKFINLKEYELVSSLQILQIYEFKNIQHLIDAYIKINNKVKKIDLIKIVVVGDKYINDLIICSKNDPNIVYQEIINCAEKDDSVNISFSEVIDFNSIIKSRDNNYAIHINTDDFVNPNINKLVNDISNCCIKSNLLNTYMTNIKIILENKRISFLKKYDEDQKIMLDILKKSKCLD